VVRPQKEELMNTEQKTSYKLRHVIDFGKSYITALVDTYSDYMSARKKADKLRKLSPGIYLIKEIKTEIVCVSKPKKEGK